MTVSIKASYQAIDSGGGVTIPISGPLAFGDFIVLIAEAGGQIYSVGHTIASDTKLWTRASYLYGDEAQASIWTYPVGTPELGGFSVDCYQDSGDPYRIVVLVMDGPVKMQIVERFRDGSIVPDTGDPAIFPAANFSTTFSTLTGELAVYMLGSRNSTDIPTSTRGTVLYHQDVSDTWALWTDDSLGGDITVTLHAPERTGHARFVIRFMDPLTNTETLGPAGTNRIGVAPYIELNQISEAVASEDLTKDLTEPNAAMTYNRFSDGTIQYQTYRPLWFKFKPETDGWYRFDTELSRPAADTDTVVSVFWLDPDTRRYAEIDANDNDGIYFTSIANAYLYAGATYYIKVETWIGTVNTFYVLRVLEGDPEPIVFPVRLPDVAYVLTGGQELGNADFSTV